MNKMAKNEEIVFKGRTFEIVNKVMEGKGKSFSLEIARRSPGVRLIIVKGNRLLLTREYRYELKAYDYRLPGGKVFDSLNEYRAALEKKTDILKAATQAAKKECREETGLLAKKIRHFHTSIAGITVQWDLFYFVIDDFDEGQQDLGEAEIIHPEWMTFGQAKKLCMEGKMSEDRSVGVLLRFLGKNK